MYTRRYDDRRPPENYSGNAFRVDSAPAPSPPANAENGTPTDGTPAEQPLPPEAAKETQAQIPPNNVPPPQFHEAPPQYQNPPNPAPQFQQQFQIPPQFQAQPRYEPPLNPENRYAFPNGAPYINPPEFVPEPQPPPAPPPKDRPRGILDGLFSRFEKGFDFDDILLIGLIILLSSGKFAGEDQCENSDDLLIILGLLLFMGF